MKSDIHSFLEEEMAFDLKALCLSSAFLGCGWLGGTIYLHTDNMMSVESDRLIRNTSLAQGYSLPQDEKNLNAVLSILTGHGENVFNGYATIDELTPPSREYIYWGNDDSFVNIITGTKRGINAWAHIFGAQDLFESEDFPIYIGFTDYFEDSNVKGTLKVDDKKMVITLPRYRPEDTKDNRANSYSYPYAYIAVSLVARAHELRKQGVWEISLEYDPTENASKRRIAPSRNAEDKSAALSTGLHHHSPN